MESLLRDIRFALRSLRRQPVFTVTAVLTLGLGIGASTAIFSVVEGALLRQLPFRTPERLAFIWGVAGPQRAIRGGSPIEVLDWAARNRTFEHVAIYDETSLNLQTPEGAERVEAEMVSASYFEMLGADAAVGRTFTAAEDSIPDADPLVTISDDMWRTRFGADPSIVGRTITLNDRPFTIVGVMRPGFKGISFDTDVWFPSMMIGANVRGDGVLTNRGGRWLGAVGRLRDGVTLEAAQLDLDAVAAQLAKEFPESNADRSAQAFGLRDSYLGTTSQLLIAVLVGVGLLLLIACANVAGLQLVRGSARRQEIALRMAIGAGRKQLSQQLLMEGFVLAVGGAIAGIVIATWSVAGLTALAPDGLLPPYATPAISTTTFAFVAAVTLLCGTIFGLVPARLSVRLDLLDSLKSSGRGSPAGLGGGGTARLGAHQAVVIAECAIALVILVGAGLFVRSLQNELAVRPGFDPEGVLRARLTLPRDYSTEARQQLARQLSARLGAIPSISDVVVATDLPLGGASSAAFIQVKEGQDRVRFYRHMVDTAFFSGLRIPILRGRAFTADDRDGAPAVVVINESMARRFWPDADPIGERLRLGGPDGPEVAVVGVAGDVRYRDLRTPLATSEPDVYLPLAQWGIGQLQVAVRSRLDPELAAGSVRREIAAIDPAVPVFGLQPMESLLEQQTAQGRFASTMLSAFGLGALVLTGVGLYGVLAFLVSLRRREIGIRIALGATNRRVLQGIVAHGLRLAVIGLTIGVVAAIGATRWISGQLFGVGAHDPLVFVSVPLVILVIAALASWAPARRAALVDPQTALRAE